MKKMGVLKNNGRLMGVTKIPRKSPFNPKKLQKKAPIGKKLAKKKENRLMVGAMKSAFFFNGHSQKKRRDLYLPIFWKLIFWPRKRKCLSHTVFLYIISISTATGFLLKFFLANFCNLCRTNYRYVFLNFYQAKEQIMVTLFKHFWRFLETLKIQIMVTNS